KTVQTPQGVQIDPNAEWAIKQAISFAPKREEGHVTLAQIYAYEGKWADSEKQILDLMEVFPKDNGLKAQLSSIYRAQGKQDLAIKSMEEALNQGFAFGSYAEVEWLVN